MRRHRRCAACGIAGLIAGFTVPAAAVAATIPVTTTDDAVSADAVCSLREALNAANSDTAANGCPAGSGADEITLRAATYRLTRPGSDDADVNAGGDLDVTSAVTFRGAGAGVTTIDGNLADRVLDVTAGGVVTVRDLTITRGHAPDGAAGTSDIAGSGLSVNGGNGRAGASGGGIRSAGALTVVSSTIVANLAGAGGRGGAAHGIGGFLGSGGGGAVSGGGGAGGAGGGIFASGPLTVTDSRLADNRAGSGGAGGEAVAGNGAAGATGAGGAGGDAVNGPGGVGGRGGAIAASAALVISRTIISGNRSGSGGSAANAVGGAGGKGGVMGTTPGGAGGRAIGPFNGAGGQGGGVHSGGGLTMIDSTVTGNVAGNGGDGGASAGGAGGAHGGGTGANGTGGTATGGFGGTGGHGGGMALLGPSSLERVTLAGNLAGNGGAGGTATGAGGAEGGGRNGGDAGQGGALEIVGATKLTNVTIDANRAGSGGPGGAGSTTGGNGGFGGTGGAVNSLASLAIAGATITGNTFGPPGASATGALGGPTGTAGKGGALSQPIGTIAMRESIVSANQAPSCSVVPPITGANNLHLALDSGCPGLEADPALGPLADNGGPTRTRAPAPDSPALDRFACSGVDQRSVPRPFGALCDIGAYERAAPLVGAVTATALTTATTATLAAPVNPNARATTVTFDFGPTVEYGKTTPPVSLAAGIAPETASAAIAGLTPGTTYHVRARATNADGSAIGPDRTFEAGKLPVNQAPVVSRLAAVPSTFAVARGRTAISAATGRTKTVPRGTSLRFTLSEAATVRLAFSRPTVGRRVVAKGKVSCVATKILPRRRAQRCTRFVAVGALSRRGRKAGRNAVAFTGRLGSRALPLGTYRLTVTATDGAGKRSRAVAAAFRVVKPRS